MTSPLSLTDAELLSEILIGVTEEMIATLGVSEFLLGIIVIPLVGNAAEHGAPVIVAAKNKIDLSVAIAVGSSTQIALFVAPLLVLVSLFFEKPMSLAFDSFEVAAVAIATGVVTSSRWTASRTGWKAPSCWPSI